MAYNKAYYADYYKKNRERIIANVKRRYREKFGGLKNDSKKRAASNT